MNIITKYNIWQQVIIKAIEQPGTIICIKMDGNNLFYNIEYWWNGELKSIWQSEIELKELK